MLFSSPQYSCAEFPEGQIFIKMGKGKKKITLLHTITAVAVIITCINVEYMHSRHVQIQAQDLTVLDSMTKQQNNSLCPQN